jgi:hypothetical protein
MIAMLQPAMFDYQILQVLIMISRVNVPKKWVLRISPHGSRYLEGCIDWFSIHQEMRRKRLIHHH